MSNTPPPRPKMVSYSDAMISAFRAEAAQARALGQLLLSAEMKGDWSLVAQVRGALADIALTLETSAERQAAL